MKHKLKLTKRSDGWWVTGWPDGGFEDCGPYTTKDEANEDRQGLERMLLHWDDTRETWTYTQKF